MAAYAALASLLNSIDQIMNHPRLSTSVDINQIQPLQEKAGLLLDFIDANTTEGDDLERQMASAAHAAEEVIQSHIVARILSPSAHDAETSTNFFLNVQKKMKNMKKKVRDLKRRIGYAAEVVDQIHAGSNQAGSKCSLDLQQIIQDMDAILKTAAEVKEKHKLKEEQSTHSRPDLMETAMVGFSDELIQLLDELTNQRSSRHVISIVGMGGIGKTTLAQNVYQNLLINQHFDIRAWATLSQQHNVEEILSQLLSGLEKSSSRTVDDLGLELHNALSGRRYLIILDDIWSVEAWDEVRHFFPDNGNRSRVVLTTRLSNVARDCHSNYCLTMKPLDEHESWELFCKKAFGQENCPYPELQRVAKEIARLCRGLPLSTIVIGGLFLKSPRSVEFWENVLKNISSSPNSKEKQLSLDILSLSYNHLPAHLKPCFLYMGVFEEDYEIRASRIIKLWIAEGFLRPKEAHILEEVAESYLKELIDRNLISVIKHRHNGKIGSCGIHDLLRDLCLKIAEQQEFLCVTEDQIQGTECSLTCSGRSLARSMLSRKFHGRSNHHKSLRVWNEYLDGNVNLRYLAYRPYLHGLRVWSLPSSVSLMWNLQTLIIIGSSTLIAAPLEIWKMRQLRHVKVKLCKIYIPDPPPSSDGLFMMDNLQTLSTAVNLRLYEEVCKKIPNINKLYISYGDEWEGYDDSLLDCLCNLDCLHKLESLKLSIRGNEWAKLKKMVVRFPISLNKLTLSGCQLGWEDLSMIGSLPQLQVLQLKSYSVTGRRKWSPIEGQFLRLKFLEINWCDLHYWEADNSHFPVLEKLLLSQLRNLEEIPLGMGEIPTLELIRVDCCSSSATISAINIKRDQLENQGTDALQIQLRTDYKMESLMEMVQEEGLTINFEFVAEF